MKRHLFLLFFCVSVIAPSPVFALFGGGDSPAEKRQEIRDKSGEILARLYAMQPQARHAVKTSYGYATFSNFGMKIFVAGGGSGKGVAINNRAGTESFMRMAEIQAGLGLGIKKFSLVWVFETRDGFEQFVHSGWQLGAQASAAAKREIQEVLSKARFLSLRESGFTNLRIRDLHLNSPQKELNIFAMEN